MNQTLLFLFIAVPALIFLFVIFRSNQKRMQRLVDPRQVDDAMMQLQNLTPAMAEVVSKAETINPDAKGYAKVDLELKILTSNGEPLEAQTCWLVKVESLPELEAGQMVKVKFNRKKLKIIYPDVPWAQAWIFGD